MESADLAARAERAYEAGRLRWAAQIGWIVAPLLLISFASVGPSLVSATTGLLLLATTTLLRWRGRQWSAAVRTGLMAGLIPFALLLVIKGGSFYLCSLGACMGHCAKFCGFGGFAAGLLIAGRARRLDTSVMQFLTAATVVAALTGLLGCFVGGLMGTFWMVVGEVVATVPVFALQLRRQ
jgi:hypothetical protein